MNTSAVRHRSTFDMCYAADEDTAVIRLQTGKDVEQAYIICSDPFIAELTRKKKWYGKKHPMQPTMELEEKLIWSFRIKPEFKRLQYYFEVVSGGESYLVYDNKVIPKDSTDKSSRQCFKLPWINPSDVIKPPEWVRNTVWYQIMPDRFCRSSSEPDERFESWGKFKPFKFHVMYGGDLKGITQRLPYLHKLGINGIYLTPIFLSSTYHRYNTFDYNLIDPVLGTDDDMGELVSKAHELGIRIMLDGVFNHCGTEFFAWKDVFEKGKASPYFDWFFINDETTIRKPDHDTADGRYYSFSFWSGMPKLNTNNPEVIRYFCDICSHWVSDWDIDGIRFDVGDEISHTFLRELRRTLKPIKNDIFLLGEIWFDSLPWLYGAEYDSVMNYPTCGCINGLHREESMSSTDFMYSLNTCLSMYPEQINEVLFNFIDTHDTTRIFEECNGNTDLLLQKLAMLLTLPGTPCIYYGTEIALKGRTVSDNRRCMPWDEIDAGMHEGIFSEVGKLISVRHSMPQLKSQDIKFTHSREHPRLLNYARSAEGCESIIGVYINAEKNSVALPAEGHIIYSNLYDNGILQPNGVIIYEK
ncbi:MAG: glycoside hydrolase family 13 protein [Clostridia bacterium]|nr:glycoside hydrolase family 13 protein [Clostridia bacterium]